MINRKITLVADYLHYPIPISQIEKMVISTQIFNRLHNILQNSTVFFTYPSNRTSRFSHSLGCMHIAGTIFRNGFINSEEEQKRRFLSDIQKEIKRITDSSDFKTNINHIFPTHCPKNPGEIQKEKGQHLNELFYKTILPGDLDNKEDRYAFLISYQSVRIVALLHDLGHPPFSHVTENALNDLFDDYSKENSGEKTENLLKFIELLSHYKRENRFHEALGETLVNFLFFNVLDSLKNSDEWELCYESLIIKYFVLRIYQTDTENEDKPDIFWSFHRIVDNNLDADRLDYVNRDLSMSGINKDTFRFGRLLSSFQMVYHTKELTIPKNNDEGILEFLPSVRALSTIEEFFHRRLDLYKYVIYHHRVVKTDGLMGSCIKELAKEYFMNPTNKNETPRETSPLLPQNISGLWSVLDPDYKDECVNSYIQWDDAWLLSVFRKRYFELQLESKNNGGNQSLLEIKLEEILSNKKSYFSLYKGIDSFLLVDETMINSISKNFDWEKFKNLLSVEDNNVLTSTLCYDYVDNYYQKYKNAFDNGRLVEGYSEIHESSGFFLSTLRKAFFNASKLGSFKLIVSEATERLKNEKIIDELEIEDTLILYKQLSPGVKSPLHLVMDDQVVKLGAVSRIADELQRSSNLFPPFFVYFYSMNCSTHVLSRGIIELRKSFGKFLSKSLENWVINSN